MIILLIMTMTLICRHYWIDRHNASVKYWLWVIILKASSCYWNLEGDGATVILVENLEHSLNKERLGGDQSYQSFPSRMVNIIKSMLSGQALKITKYHISYHGWMQVLFNECEKLHFLTGRCFWNRWVWSPRGRPLTSWKPAAKCEQYLDSSDGHLSTQITEW